MSVQPLVLSIESERTSPKFAQAFVRGCGGRYVPVPPLLEVERPIAFFASPVIWPMILEAQAKRIDYYYGDHGYFDRTRYLRIARNAFQHDGRGSKSPERFRRFGLSVQPWRKTGRHVLVCPNSRVYFSLFGLNVDDWIADVTTEIGRATDREVRIRWKADARSRPIKSDLVDCWAVVVFSSNAAVDALLAGVPVFTLAPFAATARMGLSTLSSIEAPFYPDDRIPFMCSLADNQWTLEEIETGEPWRRLQNQELAGVA